MSRHNFLFLLASVTCVNLLAVKGDFVTNKSELRSKYAYLYKLPVKVLNDGSKQFHQARLFNRKGVHILSLKGDSFEMGFQHGKLLQKQSHEGALIRASQMVNNALRNNFSHRPTFLALAKNNVDKNYTTKFLKNAIKRYPKLSQEVLDRTFAFSEASNVKMNTLLDAALNPSVMMMLANAQRKNKENEYAHNYFSSCTSFFVNKEYTKDNKMLIGRNTDYPLSGEFEKESTVIYFQPTDGRQKFMSVISAGIHTASVTAINESGLYLGTHSLPSTKTGVHGTPMILWIHDVIGKARTVQQAIDLLSERQFGVGWTFVLASETENRVVSVEVDHSGFGLREWKNNKHVQTNHYLSEELKDHTLYFNRGTFEETHNRFDRAHTLIESFKGKLDPMLAIRILGDHHDNYSQHALGFPSNIGATTTVSSIIYQPSQKRIWLATGLAPVPHHPYLSLPSPDAFNPNSFATMPVQTIHNTWFQSQDTSHLKSLRHYILAKEAFEYDADLSTVNFHLEEATKLNPTLGHYWLMKGLLEIRSQYFSKAKNSLLRGLKNPLSRHAHQLTHYYLGRLYAKERNSKLGIMHFNKVLQTDTDPTLKEATLWVRNRLERFGYVRLRWFDVIPLFQFGDLQRYLKK